MQLLTTTGFFSTRAHKDDPDMIEVRFRSMGDYHRLNNREAYTLPEVKASPATDYPFRFTISKERWAAIVAALILDVDYPSFTKAVAERLGVERQRIYKRAWLPLIFIENDDDSEVPHGR